MPPPSQPRGAAVRSSVLAPRPDGVRRFRPPPRGIVGAREPGERPFSANPTPRRCAITRRESGSRGRPQDLVDARAPARSRRGSRRARQRPVDGSSSARLSLPPSRGATAARQVPGGPRAGGRGRARLARRRPVPRRLRGPQAHRPPYPGRPDRLFAARRPRRPCAGAHAIGPAGSIGWAARAPRFPRAGAAGVASQPAGSGRPDRRPARHRSLPPAARASSAASCSMTARPPWRGTGPARGVSLRSRCVRISSSVIVSAVRS